jgi:hypothetical protein
MLRLEIEQSYLRKNAIKKGANLKHIINSSNNSDTSFSSPVDSVVISKFASRFASPERNSQIPTLNKKYINALDHYYPNLHKIPQTSLNSRKASPFRESLMKNELQANTKDFLVKLPSMKEIIESLDDKHKEIKLLGSNNLALRRYNIKLLQEPRKIQSDGGKSTKQKIFQHFKLNSVFNSVEKSAKLETLKRAPSLSECKKAMREFYSLSSNGVNPYKLLSNSIASLNYKKYELDLNLQHKLERQSNERLQKVEQKRSLLKSAMSNCPSTGIGNPVTRDAEGKSR